MRSRGVAIAAILVALFLAAAAAALAASPGPGSDPAVRRWSGWTDLVRCGSGPFDPLEAFARPPDAEAGTTAADEALRSVLQSGELASVGARKEGWRVLFEDEDRVEFGNGQPSEGPIQTLTFGLFEGTWKREGFFDACRPRVIYEGQRAAAWRLIPGQHLRPTTKSIKVGLETGPCSGGVTPKERLEEPRFRVEHGALLVTLWLRPLHGPQTCQGYPNPPATIRLPGRLGHLKLLDGTVFPPRPPLEGREP